MKPEECPCPPLSPQVDPRQPTLPRSQLHLSPRPRPRQRRASRRVTRRHFVRAARASCAYRTRATLLMGARQAPGQVRVGRAGRGAGLGMAPGQGQDGTLEGPLASWQVRAWPLLAPAPLLAPVLRKNILLKNHPKVNINIG